MSLCRGEKANAETSVKSTKTEARSGRRPLPLPLLTLRSEYDSHMMYYTVAMVTKSRNKKMEWVNSVDMGRIKPKIDVVIKFRNSGSSSYPMMFSVL